MMSNRPKLGFEDDETPSPVSPRAGSLDLTGFQPTPATRPDKAIVEEAAAKTNFRSREPRTVLATPEPAPTAAKPQRRRRTGRSAQLNLKCRPDTIEQFYSVADKQGWMLGEAFEKAVALLQERFGS